jgi:hypothetical protein
MSRVEIDMHDMATGPHLEHVDAPCMTERCCSSCLRVHNKRLRLLSEASAFAQAAQFALQRAAELWTRSEDAAAKQFRTFAVCGLNEEARVRRGEASRIDIHDGCVHGKEGSGDDEEK